MDFFKSYIVAREARWHWLTSPQGLIVVGLIAGIFIFLWAYTYREEIGRFFSRLFKR